MSNQEHLKSFDNNGCPDFDDMVSLGLIPGVSNYHLAGTGKSGASGATSVISAVNNVEMTTAAKLKISSESDNDKTGGTGALTATVYGLDANWNVQTETITLNGKTAVETTKTFIHPYLIRCNTAGTGGTNDGIIHVGAGVVDADGKPATKYLAVPVGDVISRSAFFPVPVGYKLKIEEVGFNYNIASPSANVTFKGRVKPFGGLWETRISKTIGSGLVEEKIKAPAYEEKTLIMLTAAAASAVDVDGYVNFRLFKVND